MGREVQSSYHEPAARSLPRHDQWEQPFCTKLGASRRMGAPSTHRSATSVSTQTQMRLHSSNLSNLQLPQLFTHVHPALCDLRPALSDPTALPRSAPLPAPCGSRWISKGRRDPFASSARRRRVFGSTEVGALSMAHLHEVPNGKQLVAPLLEEPRRGATGAPGSFWNPETDHFGTRGQENSPGLQSDTSFADHFGTRILR